jgi:hypothetical protein
MGRRRYLRVAGRIAAATAASYLAWLLVAFVLLEWPRLFLAVVSAVELEGFELRPGRWFLPRGIVPHAITRFPEDGSALLYALYQSSFILWGIALLASAAAMVRRATGWWRLLSAHAVIWCTTPLLLFSGVLWGRRSGPLTASARALGWDGSEAVLRVAAGLTLGAILMAGLFDSAHRLLGSAAEARTGRLLALGQWLVAPAVLASLFLNHRLWPYLGSYVLALALSPAILALLAGVPAALARGRRTAPLRLSGAGGIVLFAVFVLAFGASLGAGRITQRSDPTGMVEYASRHWQVYLSGGEHTQAEAAQLADAADRRLETMAERLDLKLPNPRPSAYFYGSADAKRGATGDDESFSVAAESHTIHLLLKPDGQLMDERGDALLLMQAAWGEPGTEAVAHALARYATGSFHRYALADYAGRIEREEKAYSLTEVMGFEGDYLSPLVRDALGGAWVESLRQRHGPEILPKLYRAQLAPDTKKEFARRLGATWQELEAEWRRTLREVAGETQLQKNVEAKDHYHRGISFSHEVGGRWGYGSDRGLEQLRRIRDLGANTIALVPYAFTRAPRETYIHTNTDESDDRVVRTLEAAQQLGLRVTLKPQLWARGFTGDIAFEDTADFERWFEHYRRWVLHYARLAELHEVDLLVIGTELGGVSGREAAWRGLIADVRRVYSGPLTYAANWDREFEALPFWDALDYLGLNMYYSLAAANETPQHDSPRVQELVKKIGALARRHNKKVLFTEVGYPSTANAAVEPWTEDGGSLDVEMQRQCYETVFEAFSPQPWLAGLYWWKWPSHGRGSLHEGNYSPLGKPALDVVAQWYGKGEEH